MDLNKFTERARGFVQAAQTIVLREGHQRLTPEHILKALLDDDQGMAANLITHAGGNMARVSEAVETAIGKLPKVSGDASQIYLDGQTTGFWMKLARSLKKRATVLSRSNVC